MMTEFSGFLTYLLTLVVVFLGVYAGALLAFIAPEELKNGKKYFRGLMHALVGFIAALLVYFYAYNIYWSLAVGLLLLVMMYLLPHAHYVDQIVYLTMGAAFLLSTRNQELFIANSAMIFLYGMPLASDYIERNSKKSKKTLLGDLFLAYGAFIVVGLFANLIAIYIGRI
ncbi:TPA: hypothetical protein HA265_03925 [Candidatus Woesearchaeota archaeon]|nr:hypothetical protein [Candidatus Woesearchaeota archaeon]